MEGETFLNVRKKIHAQASQVNYLSKTVFIVRKLLYYCIGGATLFPSSIYTANLTELRLCFGKIETFRKRQKAAFYYFIHIRNNVYALEMFIMHGL